MLLDALYLFLAVWLGLCLLLWVGQERLIFFPRPLDNSSRESLAAHALVATADDGTKLAGWAIAADSKDAGAAIFYGGNGQEISSAVAELPGYLGLAAAGLNYRGYGDSEGKPSADALRADALVAFDAAVKRLGVPEERWIVIGRSLGSHMASFVAANRNVAAVVLITPFDSVASIAAGRYPIFPVRLMLRHHFDTLAETASISAPTLVIRASDDYVVPAKSTDRLLDGWAGSGKVTVAEIPSSGHNDIDASDTYWQGLREFCDAALEGAGKPSGS